MRAWLIATPLLLFAAFAWAQVAVPPVARVIDQTGTLGNAQQQALSDKLAAFEQATGSQIAVLLLSSTAPESVEQYAIRVAEAWKLGRKGVDDGALLVVAMDDRAVRIEVGYGLEGAIPDAIAKRVIEEIVLPRFRAGDFAGGVQAGVDRLMGLVGGEPLPPPKKRAVETVDDDKLPVLVAFMAVGMSLVAAIIAFALAALIGRKPAVALVTIIGAGAAWWFTNLWMPALIVAGASALMAWMVTSPASPKTAGSWSSGSVASADGGAPHSTYSGSTYDSGSSSSDSFSGGGGSFGGGGASGRW